MTGNPYIVPAFILIAAVLLACVTALARRPVRPAGRHSRPARRAHAAKPFADPQDLADPDGEQYVGQLAGAAGPGYGTNYDHPGWDGLAVPGRTTAGPAVPDLEWWKQLPPAGPPAVEILTGPRARMISEPAYRPDELLSARHDGPDMTGPLVDWEPVPDEGAPAVTIGTLGRVRRALMPDAWKPEPPTFTPADADETRLDLQPVPDVIP